jgi:hypothetical protein
VVGQFSSDAHFKSGEVGALLIPQFSGAAGPVLTVAITLDDDRLESNPSFRFDNLAPGAYVLYALSHPDTVEYRNPEFLRTLPAGVPVQIDGEESKTVKLTAVVR